VLEPSRPPGKAVAYRTMTEPGTNRPYWYDPKTKEAFWEDPTPPQARDETLLADHDRLDGHWWDVPAELLRRRRGFPDAPGRTGALGGDGAARVWWRAPRPNGGSEARAYAVHRYRLDAGRWAFKGAPNVRTRCLLAIYPGPIPGARARARKALFCLKTF
jgi:hypothetical protein